MRRYLARIAAAVLLFSGCTGATQTSKSVPGSGGVVAEAPSFKIGDEWRWEGGEYPAFSRVVALEGDGSVVDSNTDVSCRDGCRYVRDRNTNITSGRSGKGEPAYVAGLKLLEFPLTVGKEWTQSKDLRRLSDGRTDPYVMSWKVEAFEEVTVKAGTFRAFRISWYQENRGPSSWTGKSTLWWSPEAKAFVKLLRTRVDGAGTGS